MKRLLGKISSGFVNTIGKKRIEKAITALAYICGIDLMVLAYNQMGILNCENSTVSGEEFFIKRILKYSLKDQTRPVIFDVGANIGKYSQMITKEFPNADIYAFEPNKNTFSTLTNNVSPLIQCINIGLGSKQKSHRLFTYTSNPASSHASMYGDVFKVFHKAQDITSMDFEMDTIDNFCQNRDIKQIDFLKIDTEGNEFDVLTGGMNMISGGNVKIIQFEFGECNVFSRVFLKDIYEMLPNFRIYRLNSNRLIPLFEYNSTNEIFRFQNFVAINNQFPVI